MSAFSFEPTEVAPRLLAWYGREGRDLPWRGTRDPYRIWLSEIMLQQTTVAAVVPFYERFLAVFPDVETLAAAPVETVVEIWAGMGYYSRARNLRAAAKRVSTEFGGKFPAILEDLLTLPGVGRSTAGAILSIAFDLPAPILDGNVRRVLCRLFAWRDDPRSAPAEKQLWTWATALTPADRPHDYAQAIMDLGATLCTPRQPDCPSCPLEGICAARRGGLENELPARRTRRAVPVRRQVAVVLRRGDRYLVRRRPLEGMLGGLWEFPSGELGDSTDPGIGVRRILEEIHQATEAAELGRIRHVYSHFQLDLLLYSASAPTADRVFEGETRWVDALELASLPLHGAHKKAVKLILEGKIPAKQVNRAKGASQDVENSFARADQKYPDAKGSGAVR